MWWPQVVVGGKWTFWKMPLQTISQITNRLISHLLRVLFAEWNDTPPQRSVMWQSWQHLVRFRLKKRSITTSFIIFPSHCCPLSLFKDKISSVLLSLNLSDVRYRSLNQTHNLNPAIVRSAHSQSGKRKNDLVKQSGHDSRWQRCHVI